MGYSRGSWGEFLFAAPLSPTCTHNLTHHLPQSWAHAIWLCQQGCLASPAPVTQEPPPSHSCPQTVLLCLAACQHYPGGFEDISGLDFSPGHSDIAFTLWCWRRLLRVHWTAGRSNQSILKEISTEYSFEGRILKLKLQYFVHLMQRTD